MLYSARMVSRLQPLSLLSSTIIFSCLFSIGAATCYFPNGKVNTGYKQCPDSLSCCLEGESCLSNGLCFTANFGILYRGLCADKSWPIAECPRACYEEIDDGWANLFQCNTSSTLLTCSHDVSAGTACLPKSALGTFDYTTANVTIAQNGFPVAQNQTCNSTDATTNQTTSSSVASASNTCPSTVSYNKTQLVAIGAGLGAGLGIPLILAGGLLIYCSRGKRRQRKQLKDQQNNQQSHQQQNYHQYTPQAMSQPTNLEMHRRTGSFWKPSELRSSFAGHNELAGSTHARSELPGSS